MVTDAFGHQLSPNLLFFLPPTLTLALITDSHEGLNAMNNNILQEVLFFGYSLYM